MKKLIFTLSTLFFLSTMVLAQFGEKRTYDAEGMDGEIRDVPDFSGIIVSKGIYLRLHQSDERRVEVKSGDLPLNEIKTEVKKGILHVKPISSVNFKSNNSMPEVDVWIDDLESVVAKMGAQVHSDDLFEMKSLVLKGTMGSQFALNLNVEKLEVKSGMGSNCILKGEADSMVIEGGAGSGFNGENLKARRGEILMKGGSTARVSISEEVSAKASFGGSIGIEGNPKMLKEKESMGGEIYSRKKRETL